MLIDELPPQRSMPAAERHLMRRELEATISKSTRSWWRLGRGMSLGLGIVVIVAGSAAAGMLIPTKGTLPYVGNGTLQWQQVPDYIAVATSSGALAGYAPRSDVLLPASDNGKPVPNGFGSVPVPVYASNLKTLVGHLYPGIGFVPLGTSPASLRCEPESVIQGTTTSTIPCPNVSLTLPNVVGMSTPAAAGELSGLGVFVNVVDVNSPTAPLGTIVKMSPSGGSKVPARTMITIENVSSNN